MELGSKSNRSFNNLPEEIVEKILWYLSPYRECDDAARVCKVWNRLIHGSGPRSMPSPRASASMVYYKGLLIVFGGWAPPLPSPLYPAPRFYNELHVYDMALNQWSAITTSVTPPPMAGHRATVVKNKMIIFGGWHVQERSNDIWVLNMDKMEWHKQDTKQPKPLERSGHGQIKINDQYQLIIGGWGKNGMLCDDIWLLHMDPCLPWNWTPIQIDNAAHSPPEIWCHPVVKVGNSVVVYSRSKRPQHKHHNPCISSMRTGPRASNELREAVPVANNIDNCVNGIRGSLQKSATDNSYENRDQPLTSKTNSAFCGQDYPGLHCSCKWPTKAQTQSTLLVRSPLQLYILDITNVLSDHIVKWRVAVQNGNQVSDQIRAFPLDHRPPPERISFYSVVLGQAEMVMFGGAVMDPEVGRRTTAVNSAHFAC
ncbi:F-box only protein 42-like isoform X2 [Anneissia japonica]|uniref:F-box only protein 42-like isoform X2 n=1 Tax=Anneissia japonica TaxID=1529436 RepID=UPI0014258EFB|nr:F-box only protein 42-like isoform X2 [Anneissia japonica]